MCRLVRIGVLLLIGVAWAASAGAAGAQETPSAKATRKKLKKKITVEFNKETRIKEVVDDIRREFDNRLGVKIDNTSGISNNTKVAIVAKDQPLEKILNTLCDKYEMGWYVVSDAKDRLDGWIVLRKSKYKERGYEGGKEPKGKTSLRSPETPGAPLPHSVTAAVPQRRQVLALPPARSFGLR